MKILKQISTKQGVKMWIRLTLDTGLWTR